MFKRIDHIGIAVRDLAASITYFKEKFGLIPDYEINLRGFHAAFFPTRDTPLELIRDHSPNGAIAKFLEKRGEGVHHIAFEVEDIRSALETLRSKGIRTLDEDPKEGAHDTLVAFLHPKDTYGMLIELVEYRKPCSSPR